jgi:hypothetical protein
MTIEIGDRGRQMWSWAHRFWEKGAPIRDEEVGTLKPSVTTVQEVKSEPFEPGDVNKVSGDKEAAAEHGTKRRFLRQRLKLSNYQQKLHDALRTKHGVRRHPPQQH